MLTLSQIPLIYGFTSVDQTDVISIQIGEIVRYFLGVSHGVHNVVGVCTAQVIDVFLRNEFVCVIEVMRSEAMHHLVRVCWRLGDKIIVKPDVYIAKFNVIFG